jgi:N6-L-threonylcarbamoyladenine synthase
MALPHMTPSAPTTRILAIETSCDETAAAVIDDGRFIRSNIIASQIDLHQQYGGVFPEMASRAHIEAITPTIQQALREANVTWDSLSAVAVTKGPGLPGSLVVGVNAAKGICLAKSLPLIGINHLEGHIYSHWLDQPSNRSVIQSLIPNPQFPTPFPLIILIVSGGHTELVLMREHGQYELIGQTADDAAGEAFDKVARALQLGYPGGPAIQKAAQQGNPLRFKFSRPRVGATGLRGAKRANEGAFDFSFSGTKTSVLQLIQQFNIGQSVKDVNDGLLSPRVPVADIAASFQHNAVDWLVEKTARAAEAFGAKAVLAGGGVSANALLRERMTAALNIPTSFPPLALCTDNAAMIGAAGHYAYMRGVRDSLDMDVVPDLQLGD